MSRSQRSLLVGVVAGVVVGLIGPAYGAIAALLVMSVLAGREDSVRIAHIVIAFTTTVAIAFILRGGDDGALFANAVGALVVLAISLLPIMLARLRSSPKAER